MEEKYIPDWLFEKCKKCKNLWSSYECEICEDFDMYGTKDRKKDLIIEQLNKGEKNLVLNKKMEEK